ncbi:MAG: methyltransferase domain-containing protein [Candidatus Bathyarchaeota archaeon]|nr:MAG: methyltransferase domain-containing protein [Candidatus Bathyarchaeota archaeon]
MSDRSREYAYAGRLEEARRLEAQANALGTIIEKELNILGLKPNMKVLDAGCGTGAVTRRMASKVFPEKVCGVDIDPLFIDEAKKAASREGLTNVQFTLGNIDNLKYEKGRFDLSYCRLVLMHVHNTVKTISELKRVTKRRGIVAASDIDDGAMLWFPQTPRFFNLWSKFGQWAKARGDDRYIGRQLFSIFSEADLDSVNIYPIPMYGSQQSPVALKMLVSVPVQIIEQDKEELIKEGVITAKDYRESLSEVQLVLSHPGAFAMGMTFLATGEVP